MSTDEIPWELKRQSAHFQQVYGPETLKEILELFGDKSAEYGLALAGSHQLTKLLEKHNHRFSPEAIIHVNTGTAHASGIVDAAERHIAIAKLKEQVDEVIARRKEPAWLTS